MQSIPKPYLTSICARTLAKYLDEQSLPSNTPCYFVGNMFSNGKYMFTLSIEGGKGHSFFTIPQQKLAMELMEKLRINKNHFVNAPSGTRYPLTLGMVEAVLPTTQTLRVAKLNLLIAED